ncbi:MAG: ribonuclease Z [Flavobacterium sp.]
MKVERKGHTTIIRNTRGKTLEFLNILTTEYNTFKNHNLIIDLLQDKELTLDDVKSFIDLTKTHRKGKKSLVLVADNVNYTAVPDSITLVPTILEAHDIIEMEEIERDLGF